MTRSSQKTAWKLWRRRKPWEWLVASCLYPGCGEQREIVSLRSEVDRHESVNGTSDLAANAIKKVDQSAAATIAIRFMPLLAEPWRLLGQHLQDKAHPAGFAVERQVDGNIIIQLSDLEMPTQIVTLRLDELSVELGRFYELCLIYDGSSQASGIQTYLDGKSLLAVVTGADTSAKISLPALSKILPGNDGALGTIDRFEVRAGVQATLCATSLQPTPTPMSTPHPSPGGTASNDLPTPTPTSTATPEPTSQQPSDEAGTSGSLDEINSIALPPPEVTEAAEAEAQATEATEAPEGDWDAARKDNDDNENEPLASTVESTLPPLGLRSSSPHVASVLHAPAEESRGRIDLHVASTDGLYIMTDAKSEHPALHFRSKDRYDALPMPAMPSTRRPWNLVWSGSHLLLVDDHGSVHRFERSVNGWSEVRSALADGPLKLHLSVADDALAIINLKDGSGQVHSLKEEAKP